MKEVEMFERFRARARDRTGMTLPLLVSFLVALAVAAPASASNAAIVVPFEKHWVGPGHYVGPASDGGESQFTGVGPRNSVRLQPCPAPEMRPGFGGFISRPLDRSSRGGPSARSLRHALRRPEGSGFEIVMGRYAASSYS
jgi:hypothetical protein